MKQNPSLDTDSRPVVQEIAEPESSLTSSEKPPHTELD